MINIPIIGVASALLICATLVKVFADQPKKVDKSQKGEILKQLLALSEHENKTSATTSPVRVRTPLPNQGRRPSNGPRKAATRISQPIRSGK